MISKREHRHQHTIGDTEKSEITWEEIGFAEFPIVTTSLKRPPVDTLEFAEQVGTNDDGEPRYRTWKLVGSSEYGLPRLPDLDIFVGILKLLEQHNYERRLIVCTARDLCAIAGLTRGGETYNRIKAALQRFTHTGYSARNVFRHPLSKEPVLAEDWNIIADFRLLPDHQDPSLQDGLPASYLAVSAAFLNRLKNGQLKPVNLGLWRELPLGLEKPIYHYLDKNFYGGKDRHEIGLNKFGNRIALMGTYKPSQLKRLYNKPLANLTKLGFLSGFRFEKSRSAEDPEKIVFFPGSRARIQRKPAQRVPMYQRASEPVSGGRIRGNSTIPGSEVDQLVAYFSLRQFKVVKTNASPRERLTGQKILEHAGGDYAASRAIIDFAIEEAKKIGFGMRNIGAVLTNSYPERALAALKAVRMNASATIEQGTQADLKYRYETWHRQEVKKRYETLEPGDRDRMLGEALEELRTGRRPVSSLDISEHHLRLMAESKVRGLLGRDLPSFDDWRSQHS